MRAFIRYDVLNDIAELEDEAGNDLGVDVTIERDGTFTLFGPLEVELDETRR